MRSTFARPDTLWAKALRSPYPAAGIKSVDVSRAEALPGVRAVLTGADVEGRLQGRQVRDVPLLAQDIVRFAGEKVAVVAADDEETAQRATGMIVVGVRGDDAAARCAGSDAA